MHGASLSRQWKREALELALIFVSLETAQSCDDLLLRCLQARFPQSWIQRKTAYDKKVADNDSSFLYDVSMDNESTDTLEKDQGIVCNL